MKALFFGVAALALVSAPAMAKSNPDGADSAQTSGDKGKDGSERICKREKIIGSRLGSKKTCATAAEWAQMRADQRQATERVQNNRPRAGN